MKKTNPSGFIDDLSEEQIDMLVQFKSRITAQKLVSLEDPRYDDC